eukprot:5845030-Pleurochrysis_carterae.AAC.4
MLAGAAPVKQPRGNAQLRTDSRGEVSRPYAEQLRAQASCEQWGLACCAFHTGRNRVLMCAQDLLSS